MSISPGGVDNTRAHLLFNRELTPVTQGETMTRQPQQPRTHAQEVWAAGAAGALVILVGLCAGRVGAIALASLWGA